jgi:hypothetical protein
VLAGDGLDGDAILGALVELVGVLADGDPQLISWAVEILEATRALPC